MSVRWFRPALVASALIATCACVPAFAQGHTATTTAQTKPRAALTDVVLPTGEHVGVGIDATGRARTVVAPAHRTIDSVATVRLGADSYVVPTVAGPYLQRLLDPALFDVTALARAGATGRVPVRIGYTGTTKPSVPGIAITGATGGVATGYLTAQSASVFGAALQKQYLADHRAGWPAHAALFGNVTRISGAFTTPPGAAPQFVQKTLIIDGLDAAGKPLPDGIVVLLNVDDGRKFNSLVEIVDGQARVSVPVGHYAGIAEVDELSAAGSTGAIRLVPFDNVSVTTNNQHLTIDGRRATSTLAVRTPRSAGLGTENWEWDRDSAGDSGGSGFGFSVGPGIAIRTAPTPVPPAAEGTLNSVASWSLEGHPTSGAPYTYDLAFAAAGVPANQSYVVTSTQVAVQQGRYYSDAGQHPGEFLRSSAFPFQFGSGGFLLPLSVPQARTEYVAASAGATWYSVLLPNDLLDDPFASSINDGPRVLPAGSSSPAYWAAGPLVPETPYVVDSAAGGVECLTCRNADTLQVLFAPVTDSTPGHTGGIATSADGTPVARLRVWADGAKIADETDTTGDDFTVKPGSATYRVVYDIDRRPSQAQQSVATHTDLSFVSASGVGGALPHGWSCGLGTGSGCAIPAMLQAAVTLPVDLNGVAPLGRSTIGLQINHTQGAPAFPVTTAALAVRVGDGSWQNLPRVTTAAGSYRFSLNLGADSAGQSVDLRVTAADGHGGRFTQSTTAAFVVGAS